VKAQETLDWEGRISAGQPGKTSYFPQENGTGRGKGNLAGYPKETFTLSLGELSHGWESWTKRPPRRKARRGNFSIQRVRNCNSTSESFCFGGGTLFLKGEEGGGWGRGYPGERKTPEDLNHLYGRKKGMRTVLPEDRAQNSLEDLQRDGNLNRGVCSRQPNFPQGR